MNCFDLLSKYLLIMERRFDAMLCSNLGYEILMRAISNVHADRRLPPTPATVYVMMMVWCGLNDEYDHQLDAVHGSDLSFL